VFRRRCARLHPTFSPVTLGAALLVAGLAEGCGGAAAPPASSPGDGPAANATVAPSAPPSRGLALTATWGDLVARVAALTQAELGDADAGCVLRPAPPEGGAHRLEADLAPAIRPLPDAPGDAVARLAAGTPTVLTVWGRFGNGADGSPVLASLTTGSPPNPGDLAVGIPRAGDWVTRPLGPASDAPSGDTGEPPPGGDGRPAVVLTADAATPVTRVIEAIGAHPEWREVTLAVVLPADTRLPPPRDDGDRSDPAQRCPEGLPPPATGTPGELAVDTVRSGIAPLVEATSRCTAEGSGAVAGGGLLELELRVAPTGQVAQACAVTDTTRDPGFRACVLEAAGKLLFPPPSPSGPVDVAVPLRVPVAEGIRHAPLCPNGG